MSTAEVDRTILDQISCPADLRALPRARVGEVAQALRAEIIENVSKTGGHLASSLGAVELLTAIHYVFETPADKLCLDVGHQGYAHKMLTGRRDGFAQIGKDGGIGKFLRRHESEYDAFGPDMPAPRSRRRSAWPVPSSTRARTSSALP